MFLSTIFKLPNLPFRPKISNACSNILKPTLKTQFSRKFVGTPVFVGKK